MSYVRMLLPLLGLLLAVLGPSTAWAKKDPAEGTLVRVIVTNEESKPLATAVIRHPAEADRHRVNSVDGSWETAVLYMPDGSELRFTPGMMLDLEVSAPGYATKVVQYQVRKRRNIVPIKLEPIEMDNTTTEEPVISFGRDQPRETTE
jgi:hypothetical protein